MEYQIEILFKFLFLKITNILDENFYHIIMKYLYQIRYTYILLMKNIILY